MERSDYTSSQFADKAGIPRPTFSQLLSGRNKKVSDEVFRKLHDAFPHLSITWLMFGEGAPLLPGYDYSGNKINPLSEASNGDSGGNLFSNSDDEISKISIHYEDEPVYGNVNKEKSETGTSYCIDKESVETLRMLRNMAIENKENGRKEKKVVRITVFYDDSSYETFVPGET